MAKELLSQIPLNVPVSISSLQLSGADRRRFLDLGIVEGTTVKPVLKSPSGDPTAYEIRGSVIALRKEDTKKIEVIK